MKIWIFMLDLDQQGISDSKLLASMLKAHPFVISKALKNITNLRNKKLAILSFYKQLVDLDVSIKT
ncbi:TPA: hypothetical protein DEP21_01225 [Patescibacteria group bacterium]|nr:hypothetical protein [Candidatus Gracilibacteria bacterium]